MVRLQVTVVKHLNRPQPTASRTRRRCYTIGQDSVCNYLRSLLHDHTLVKNHR
ncbi:hypothetical protein L210DRAFT_3590106 [Boletus edulis BED1]|uniref:Uncharacterized protein n=1 Tax=Boletus edulis BED1 TaxID=1328754 RepID=A0AAD4BAJ8_BOLED|nr:hypothetical protein L210DRAFT_3590106 [Boletus edulis BED1]